MGLLRKSGSPEDLEQRVRGLETTVGKMLQTLENLIATNDKQAELNRLQRKSIDSLIAGQKSVLDLLHTISPVQKEDEE